MALWKDPNRGDYRYEFQYNGERYTRSGFKKRAEALTARENHRQRVKGGEERRAMDLTTSTGMAFSTAANHYLDFSSRRHAKKEHDYKRLVIERFVTFHHISPENNPAFSQIMTPEHVLTFLNTRASNHNFNVHRKELSVLWTFSERTLRIVKPQDNPFFDIDKLPHTTEEKDPPSESDVIKLLLAADPETEKPLLLMILHTWGRIDEILRMKWKDVNFEKREVTLWCRKNKDGSYIPRRIFMNDDLFNILHPLFKRRKQEVWTLYNEKTENRFNRRPKMMNGICKRAKITPFGFHQLRHFAATYAADRLKISKKTIGGILGHQNLGTTEIYLHSVDSSAREAMKALEGRFK